MYSCNGYKRISKKLRGQTDGDSKTELNDYPISDYTAKCGKSAVFEGYKGYQRKVIE